MAPLRTPPASLAAHAAACVLLAIKCRECMKWKRAPLSAMLDPPLAALRGTTRRDIIDAESYVLVALHFETECPLPYTPLRTLADAAPPPYGEAIHARAVAILNDTLRLTALNVLFSPEALALAAWQLAVELSTSTRITPRAGVDGEEDVLDLLRTVYKPWPC